MLITAVVSDKPNSFYLITPMNLFMSLSFLSAACLMMFLMCNGESKTLSPTMFMLFLSLILVAFLTSLSFLVIGCIIVYIVCVHYLDSSHVDYKVPLGVFLILSSVIVMFFLILYIVALWTHSIQEQDIDRSTDQIDQFISNLSLSSNQQLNSLESSTSLSLQSSENLLSKRSGEYKNRSNNIRNDQLLLQIQSLQNALNQSRIEVDSSKLALQSSITSLTNNIMSFDDVVDRKKQEMLDFNSKINSQILPQISNNDLQNLVYNTNAQPHFKALWNVVSNPHLFNLPSVIIPGKVTRTFTAFSREDHSKDLFVGVRDLIYFSLSGQLDQNFSQYDAQNLTFLLDGELPLWKDGSLYYNNQKWDQMEGTTYAIDSQMNYKVGAEYVLLKNADFQILCLPKVNRVVVAQLSPLQIYVMDFRGIYNLPNTFYNFSQNLKQSYVYNSLSLKYEIQQEPLKSFAPLFSHIQLTTDNQSLLQYMSVINSDAYDISLNLSGRNDIGNVVLQIDQATFQCFTHLILLKSNSSSSLYEIEVNFGSVNIYTRKNGVFTKSQVLTLK